MPQDPVAPPSELFTLRDFVRWGYSRFNATGLHFGHGTDNALDETIQLLLHAVHLPHDLPETLWDARLTAAEKQTITTLFEQRIAQRRPAAYLTGEAWFAGLRLRVDERVLVPRSPLAELIEQSFAPWKDEAEIGAVLDLCTGGGCIALACAMYLPNALVDATDLSSDALEVARGNVEDYGLGERVQLWQADLFQGIPPCKYDVIISNPPYVPQAEFDQLPGEYRHEPALGLVAGDDGLTVVRRILARATEFLQPNGVLIVEVGVAMDALQAAYPEVPFTWLDFERGGDGVFLLTAEQCRAHQSRFTAPSQA